MDKYGYAYFDTNGKLVEFILDPSVRQGNDGVNKIYIYWENPQPFGKMAVTWINTDIASDDTEWSTPEVVDSSQRTFRIPAIQDYDPIKFQYGKLYTGYLVEVPEEALAEDGNIALSLVTFNDTDNNDEYNPEVDVLVMWLGLITFYAEPTGIKFQNTITQSQYFLLLSKISLMDTTIDAYLDDPISDLVANVAESTPTFVKTSVRGNDYAVSDVYEGCWLLTYKGSIMEWIKLNTYSYESQDANSSVIRILINEYTGTDLLGDVLIAGMRRDLAIDNSNRNALPSFTVYGNDNVIDFIEDNELNNKTIVLKIDGYDYIACFDQDEPGYSFQLENTINSDRYGAYISDMDDITFSDLLNNSYKHNYELVENKVTSLSNSSTDTQYPSAKLVYDQLLLKESVNNKVALGASNTVLQYPNAKSVWDAYQNLREVAEGKSKTIVISYDMTAPTTDVQAQILKKPDGTAFTDLQDFEDYVASEEDDTPGVCVNSLFNSQNSFIMIDNSYDYFISTDNIVYKYGYQDPLSAIERFGLKTGDIVLVVETDVPDRWYDYGSDYFYKLETAKVDLSNYVTKDGNETITGVKDFSNGYKVGNFEISEANVGILLYKLFDVSLLSITASALSPEQSTNLSLGQSNKKYEDLWLDRAINLGQSGIIKYENSTFTFNDDILPAVTESYDLGSSSKIWKTGYIEEIQFDDSGSFFIQKNGQSMLLRASGNPIYSRGHFRPADDNTWTLGSINLRWSALHLAGKINPNASNYGLTLPDTSSFTADSELLDTAGEQIVSGKKTFTYNNSVYFGSTRIYQDGSSIKFGSRIQIGQIFPTVDKTQDLGNGVGWYWRDLWLFRNIVTLDSNNTQQTISMQDLLNLISYAKAQGWIS